MKTDIRYRDLTAEDGNLLATDEVTSDTASYYNGRWATAIEHGISFYVGRPISEWLAGEGTNTFRARRLIKAGEYVWIQSEDRWPTEADLPILFKNGIANGIERDQHINILPDLPRGYNSFLWVPFIEPVTPPKTQAQLDDEACRAWQCEMHSLGSAETAWRAAIAWERNRAKNGGT
jgi:hypothetical protein